MKEIYYKLLFLLFYRFPIKRKKIFFLSYYGTQYGCNPKYLSEYIIANCKEWDVVWGFTEPNRHHIDGIRKVKYLSPRYFLELCTSQVFVTNYRMTNHYRKRKGQLYIQTWHSSLRLKMIEGDAEKTLPSHYVEMAKKDSLQTDVLLSGCQFSTEVFKRAFWYQGPIIQTGTPREDLMFSKNETKRKNILYKLGVETNKFIVLYAPTFRKDNSLTCYNIDFKRLQNSLSEKFGGEWKILLRLHPHLKKYSNKLLQNTQNILDVTGYDDIQELLYVSDVVVSDYSSLIFDFALTSRPCFLYASDLDSYIKNDRELYFKIQDLPFPISKDNDTLNMQIINFDKIQYEQKVTSFLQGIGSFETGHACENVVKYIRERLDNEKG